MSSCSSPDSFDANGIYTPKKSAMSGKKSFVDVRKFDSSILVDLKYKTADNFTGRPLYRKDMPALLRVSTARRLAHANRLLKEDGLRIKVWDAYRPHATQVELWEASGKDPNFVANPHRTTSKHSHGVAVDVTLVKLDGSAVPMPTLFDDFTNKAASEYIHEEEDVRTNLHLLQEAMRRAGFKAIQSEWWHFTDKDHKLYPHAPPLEDIL
eukprot:Seg19365.1 transcript_id=Seg19365.1/GoldUCD/mRNA.D3Y31 product="D-alanyl-D-alanine dipeptidase" protein_id=Seg19365.1/GoldUCD/D3Y31